MSTKQNPAIRWLGIAAVLIVCVAVGWYLGNQLGQRADDEAVDGQAERHPDIAGTVVRVDPDEGMLRVDHERIDGFMAAMEMDLQVAEPDELAGLAAGDEILFEMVSSDGDFYAADIRPADSDGSQQADAEDSEDQPRRFTDVGGEVVAADPDAGVLTVDHEAIEDFMPAMVMDLDAAEPGELRDLEPGDPIVFDLVRIQNNWQVVRIRQADARQSDAERDLPANALNPGDLVPNLTLIDSNGQVFNLHEMEERHKLITFFYVRCPLADFCPAQSQRLAELQEHVAQSGTELHLLTLTLDAEHDSPEVLESYASQFNVDPSYWTLASSDDANAIREFADRAGARIERHEQDEQIDHALVALRVDGGRIVDRVYGLDAIEQLVKQM